VGAADRRRRLLGPAFDNGGGASAIGVINGMAAVDYTADRVYFAGHRRAGGSSNTLWALDITGGGLSLAWAVDLGDIDGSPVVRDGRIYVGTTAGVVYSVRAGDGADFRSYAINDGAVKGFVLPDRTSSDLFVSTDNHVFFLKDDGVAVVSTWPEATVPGPSIPVFDASTRRLFVGGSDGRLYQIDVSGAPVVSSVQLGDGLAGVGSPTLNWIESVLYVGTEAGVVYRVTTPIP
jgi:outer membrane protein assembly factor BamB